MLDGHDFKHDSGCSRRCAAHGSGHPESGEGPCVPHLEQAGRGSRRLLQWYDFSSICRGKIPVDSIQVAKIEGGIQTADIRVDDGGYTPAVVVVKLGVKTRIRFAADKLSSCNYIVSFPEYQGQLDLSQGQLETPPLDVTGDFTFQCGMGMLHGYVKAVKDTTNVDLKAIARQVAAFTPAGPVMLLALSTQFTLY